MKRHIAELLGELAEELGWEPELEEHRVRPEQHGVSTASAPTPPPERPSRRPTSFASSSDRLNSEVNHLRATLNHLSSEVTLLRAEVARIKNLPTPPDATEAAPETTAPDVRPFPPQLVLREPAPPAPPVKAVPRVDYTPVSEPGRPPIESDVVGDGMLPVIKKPAPAREPSPQVPAADTGGDGALDMFRSEPKGTP